MFVLKTKREWIETKVQIKQKLYEKCRQNYLQR